MNGELAEALAGFDATEQEALDATMIEIDGTGNKGRLGRQRDPRGEPRGGPGGRGLHRPAALPLRRRHRGTGAAGADDEHRQRRRTCRQPHRHPGIHDHAGGRGELPRGDPDRFGNLPHAQEGTVGKAGLGTGIGDEGGFAPNLKSTREALDFILKSIGKAGYTAGDDVMLALDCAATEYFKDGAYVMEGEGQTLTPDENVAYLPPSATTTPSCRSRTAARRTTGTAGRSSPRFSAKRSSSSATIFSSPTPSGFRRASPGAARTRCW